MFSVGPRSETFCQSETADTLKFFSCLNSFSLTLHMISNSFLFVLPFLLLLELDLKIIKIHDNPCLSFKRLLLSSIYVSTDTGKFTSTFDKKTR